MKNPETVKILIALLKSQTTNDFEMHRVEVLEKDFFNPPKVEVVDGTHQKFDGVTFTRNSEGHFVQRNSIHRAVWIYYNGCIPEGDYHIHHIDRNKTNNNLENLMLLTNSEHKKLHLKIAKKTFKCEQCGKIFIASDVGTNKFCSAECREKNRNERDFIEKPCEYCGKKFLSIKRYNIRFCSHSCSTKARYADDENVGNYYEIRTCKYCGKIFSVYKYDKTKYCSCSCAQRDLKSEHRREKVCPACKKSFTTSLSANKVCCSRHCAAEFKKKKSLTKQAAIDFLKSAGSSL